MKKDKKITWLDTYGEGGYSYEDYKEWCANNEQEPAEEGSEAYWDWINWQISDEWECFFENLKYSDLNKQPVVISGSLGLWYGRPQIENTMESSLTDAVRRCADGVDAIEVYTEGGVVYVTGYHHDGRNHFEIRPLTERGAEKMREGEEICVGNHWHTGKFPEYLY